MLWMLRLLLWIGGKTGSRSIEESRRAVLAARRSRAGDRFPKDR